MQTFCAGGKYWLWRTALNTSVRYVSMCFGKGFRMLFEILIGPRPLPILSPQWLVGPHFKCITSVNTGSLAKNEPQGYRPGHLLSWSLRELVFHNNRFSVLLYDSSTHSADISWTSESDWSPAILHCLISQFFKCVSSWQDKTRLQVSTGLTFRADTAEAS